jgi:hypothetical protein
MTIALKRKDMRGIPETEETRAEMGGGKFGGLPAEVIVTDDQQNPEMGRQNVCSDISVAILTEFHTRGIQIPFPQRDLHLKSGNFVLQSAPDAVRSGSGAQ